MSKHLPREVERLKKRILALSALVEESVRDAVKAVVDRDAQAAARVIASDTEIDGLEVEVEEECLKTLALHQPVAIDLRFIVAVLKINNDLERIGDLSVNIAERTKNLAQHAPIPQPFDVAAMAEKVQTMLKHSLDALVNLDAELAHQVRAADEEVDDIHRQAYRQIQEEIAHHPQQVPALINYLTVSRYLERIADHATNVAEDVIYMIEGEIVRHQPEE